MDRYQERQVRGGRHSLWAQNSKGHQKPRSQDKDHYQDYVSVRLVCPFGSGSSVAQRGATTDPSSFNTLISCSPWIFCFNF